MMLHSESRKAQIPAPAVTPPEPADEKEEKKEQEKKEKMEMDEAEKSATKDKKHSPMRNATMHSALEKIGSKKASNLVNTVPLNVKNPPGRTVSGAAEKRPLVTNFPSNSFMSNQMSLSHHPDLVSVH